MYTFKDYIYMSKSKSPARRSTQFKPGVSGNPAGRPKGAKNKTTLMREAIEAMLVKKLKKDSEAVYDKCVQLALGGSETCIKIIMDRVLPVVSLREDKSDVGSKGITINISGMQVAGTEEKEPIEAEEAEYVEESSGVGTKGS